MAGDPRFAALQKMVSNIWGAINNQSASVVVDAPDETYIGTISAVGTILKQDVNGWNSFILTYSATAGSHGIRIEGNETGLDEDQWYPIAGYPIDISGTGVIALRPITGGSYTGFVYPKRFPWIRVVIPAGQYGGSGTITARLTVSRNQVYSGPYVTSIAGMANNGNAAAAAGPSPYFLGVGGITRLSNSVADTTGISNALTFTSGSQLLTKPYSVPEAEWSYAAASGGIVSTTADVAVKAAAGAGIKNYLTWVSISHDALSAATELVVQSGSTVIHREKLQTAAKEGTIYTFPCPLKGAANEAISVKVVSSVSGGVFINCGGYTAP